MWGEKKPTFGIGLFYVVGRQKCITSGSIDEKETQTRGEVLW